MVEIHRYSNKQQTDCNLIIFLLFGIFGPKYSVIIKFYSFKDFILISYYYALFIENLFEVSHYCTTIILLFLKLNYWVCVVRIICPTHLMI